MTFQPLHEKETFRYTLNITDNLFKTCKQYSFTQDDSSAYSNIAHSTLGNIETASNDVTLPKLNRIANAFNMSLFEFLKWEKM